MVYNSYKISVFQEFGYFLNIQQKEFRVVRVLQIGFLNEKVI